VNRIKPFNRYEVTSNELDFLQDVGQEEIRSRLNDGVLTAGILIPNSATVPSIDLGVGGASGSFGLSTDGSTLSVGGLSAIGSPSIHVAYNADGDRIEIPTGDAVTWRGTIGGDDATQYTTDNVGGFSGSTPFSTGRLTIPDPDFSNSSALSDLTRYVFVSYVPVTETVALPPDHESKNGDITGAPPATDNRKPITTLDQREGIAYAHHRINGYRIFVAKSDEISVDANLVPVLTGGLFPVNEPDSAKAIYIGKYTLVPSTSITGVVSVSDALHKRPLLRRRGDVSAVVGPTTRPNVYAAGDNRTFREHMGGVGTGIVSPTNVHGLHISDITGGGEEPDNRTYHDLTLGDGVIDTAITDSNNPIPNSTAFRILINNSSSITFDPGLAQFANATGDPALIANGGTSPAGRAVTVALPTVGIQSIFLGGRHLTEIFPVTTITDTPSSVGYIPFTSADAGSAASPSGYNIFVIAHPNLVTNPNAAVLGKAPIGTTLGPNRLLLGSVAWDGTDIIQSTENNSTTPIDRRSFGVVGKNQISTVGRGGASSGILSAQHFSNLAALNPDFGRNFDFWTYAQSTGRFFTAKFLKADASIPDTTLGAPVPSISIVESPMPNVIDTSLKLRDQAQTYRGVEYTFKTLSTNDLNVAARTPVGVIKPSTNYVVSLQIRATAATKTEVLANFTSADGEKAFLNFFPSSPPSTLEILKSLSLGSVSSGSLLFSSSDKS